MSFLNKLGLLSSLTKQEREELSLFTQEKVLKAGDVLFNEGDEGKAMYFLLSGVIEVSKNINGKKKVIGKVSSEEVLGEMALFGKNKTRMAKAVVVEDCELIIMLSFSVNELTNKHPDLFKKIQDIIEKRTIYNEKIGMK